MQAVLDIGLKVGEALFGTAKVAAEIGKAAAPVILPAAQYTAHTVAKAASATASIGGAIVRTTPGANFALAAGQDAMLAARSAPLLPSPIYLPISGPAPRAAPIRRTAASPKTLVINGHGAMTDTTFRLQENQGVFTPAPLDQPYIFNVDATHPLEKDLRDSNGKLRPVVGGPGVEANWTANRNTVRNVVIAPWNPNELRNFASDLETRNTNFDNKTINDRWSIIDGSNFKGNYLDRDQEAKLVFRNNQGMLSVMNHQEAKQYFHTVKNGTVSQADLARGVPIFLYAPAVGKIKVLGKTSLQEITQAMPLVYGPNEPANTNIVLATCNAKPNAAPGENPNIAYLTRSNFTFDVAANGAPAQTAAPAANTAPAAKPSETKTAAKAAPPTKPPEAKAAAKTATQPSASIANPAKINTPKLAETVANNAEDVKAVAAAPSVAASKVEAKAAEPEAISSLSVLMPTTENPPTTSQGRTPSFFAIETTKLVEKLNSDLKPEEHWSLKEEKIADNKVVAREFVQPGKNGEPDLTFTQEPQRLTTKDSNQLTFEAMLKTFFATHVPPQGRLPDIQVNSAQLKTKWENALTNVLTQLQSKTAAVMNIDKYLDQVKVAPHLGAAPKKDPAPVAPEPPPFDQIPKSLGPH